MFQEEMSMDYSEGAATFGDRLALAREAQNMSQEQLASRLGLRASTIDNWECDRSEPRANKLQMLAGFLNVSMVWLLTGEGEGAPTARVDSAAAAPEIGDILAEIREIRAANLSADSRLSRLEKRLRDMVEPA